MMVQFIEMSPEVGITSGEVIPGEVIPGEVSCGFTVKTTVKPLH